MMMMQVFGLSAGIASDAVHIAVGRHGEMHFFHGRPFSLRVLVAAAAAVPNFNVIEQCLEPLERSRGGRHLHARR
jgi:adenosylmethionine-8-amino-7-oxononanoate aminotransferase